MKTYNERLPLIDAAIEATDGDIERIKDYRKTDTYINYTVKLGYFSVDSQWAFHGETICTHDEYEQRARELGYKPKEQEMNNNNWYEKGELPPVGEICNYKTSLGKSVKVEITAHSRMGICFCEVGRDSESYVSKGQILNFEPLRTETDKLIEQMERSFESTGCVFTNDHRALAEHLIEQGYRKIKSMSEDDFIAQAPLMDLTEYFSPMQMRKLYRADCRFLDQGE